MVFTVFWNKTEEPPPPTISEVAQGFLQTPSGLNKMVVQPVVLGFKWGDWIEYPFSQTARSVKWLFQRLSTVLDWESFPSDVVAAIDRSISVADTFIVDSLTTLPSRAREAYVSVSKALSYAADGLKILHKDQWTSLSGVTLRALDIFGGMVGLSMVFEGTRGLLEQIEILKIEECGPKANLAMLKTVSKVCLIAFGILAISATLSIKLVATVISLLLSSFFLALSIAIHFYEKTHQLDKKESVAK